MKKRLKGLLALSMVVVMALAMSTGVASAVTGVNYGDINGFMYLLPNDKIYGKANDTGASFFVTKGDGTYWDQPNEGGSGTAYSDYARTDEIGNYYDGETFTLPPVVELFPDDAAGYSYMVSKNTTEVYAYAGPLTNGLSLQTSPINYIISYNANGGTGTIADETFDVTKTYTVNDGSALKRDGYRLAGWNTKNDGSGTAIPLGSDAVEFAELVKGDGFTLSSTDNKMVITLYAQWTPLDDSPDAGDSFPTSALIMLMVMSAGAAIAVKRRRA